MPAAKDIYGPTSSLPLAGRKSAGTITGLYGVAAPPDRLPAKPAPTGAHITNQNGEQPMLNHLAILTDLATHLKERPGMPPAELATRVGEALTDPTFNSEWIFNISQSQPLSAALLFSRVAEQLSGQARIEALAIAAGSSSRGGNPAIAATLITAADITMRRTPNATYPWELTALKCDHEIRSYLGLPTPEPNQSA